MSVVPDASVVVKWFVPERDHERARDLRDDYLGGRHEPVARALLPFEVVDALKYSRFPDEERLAVAAQSVVECGLERRALGQRRHHRGGPRHRRLRRQLHRAGIRSR